MIGVEDREMVKQLKHGKEMLIFFLIMMAVMVVFVITAPAEARAATFLLALFMVALFGWIMVFVSSTTVTKQWQLGTEACQNLEHQLASYKNAFASQEQHIALLESAFLTQEYVEFRLFQLASGVEALFKVEIELREDEDVEQLSDIATKIATAKKQFWVAHGVAEKLGFEVRPKISDYRAKPQ